MKREPTDAQHEALADAMCMVLNDLSDGNGVCDYVKAKARLAFEPFRLDDCGDLPDIDWARGVVADVDAPDCIPGPHGGFEENP